MSPQLLQKFGIHLLKLAGLSAALIVVATVISFLAGFAVTSLPVFWQGIATLIIPLVTAALASAKAELAAELATEQNAQLTKNLTEARAALVPAASQPDTGDSSKGRTKKSS